FFFFFSSRRRHTRSYGDWSSDVCSSDLDDADIVDDDGGRAGLVRDDGLGRQKVLQPMRPRLHPCQQIEQQIGVWPRQQFAALDRSEERRVGKEWRSRGGA